MADIKGLLADPDFAKLDPATQRQVLGQIDPAFSGLSDTDYSAFRTRMSQNMQLEKNQAVIDTREAQQPQGSALYRFGKSLYDSTIGALPKLASDVLAAPSAIMPGDVGRAARHQLYQDVVQPQVGQFKQIGSDGVLPGIGHAIAGALPVVGPMGAGIGEQMGSGDIAGGLGTAGGMAAMRYGPELAGKGASAVSRNLPSVRELVKFAAHPKTYMVKAGLEALDQHLNPTAAPDAWGKFTPQPIAKPGPPAPDPWGSFTPPSGLLPKPVQLPDRFGQFTPQPVAKPGAPPADPWAAFTPPSGLLPKPIAPVDPWGNFTPPSGLAPKPVAAPDPFGKFTPQPIAARPTPKPGAPEPIQPVAEEPVSSMRNLPTIDKFEMNRMAHARAQELELPGSPAGKSGHPQLSQTAKAVYGVRSWSELSANEMKAIHEFMDKNGRMPLKGDIPE